MSCPPLDYYAVTSAQWVAIKTAVAAKYNITIATDVGEASEDGFTIGWNYDGTNLSIQCLDKPFVVPCEMVNSDIDAAVKGVLG